MAKKVKYGYGSRANINAAIEAGKLDAYDILLLNGANETPAVGWIDKDGNPVVVDGEKCVITVEGETLPASGQVDKIYLHKNVPYIYDGQKFVGISGGAADISALEEIVNTKASLDEVDTKIKEAIENCVEVVEF